MQSQRMHLATAVPLVVEARLHRNGPIGPRSMVVWSGVAAGATALAENRRVSTILPKVPLRNGPSSRRPISTTFRATSHLPA